MAENTERKMPAPRIERVQLSGDWEGWWFDARMDTRLGVLRDLDSGRFATVIEALKKIVVGWNFVDEDGRPIPQSADGTYPSDEVPVDLYQAMGLAFYLKVQELPPA